MALPWSTESVSTENNPPKSRLQEHGTYPPPIGWSKTSPRPLREGFPGRMGGRVENAATFSDGL